MLSGRAAAARLHILGGFRLMTGNGRDAAPRSVKARVRLAHSASASDLEAIAELYAGDLLATLDVRDPSFEDYLAVERAGLRERLCRALQDGLRHTLEERNLEQLDRLAKVLLAVDPAHEDAHRALMRRHALQGDIAGAIRQYQACRDAMARELDIAPSAETEALLQEIRRGELRQHLEHHPLASSMTTVRRALHAVVTVEGRVPQAGDSADAAVITALAAALREALSRKRWLSVLNPTEVRLITPADVSERSVERQYAVVVTCLRMQDRIRFCAELRDSATSRILWSTHYDRGFGEDSFESLDDLAMMLARRLDREIELEEIIRASRQPVEALSAYDCVLRAIPLVFKLTPQSFAEAERLLLAAQDADPYDPLVYSWRAFWYSIDIGQNWARDLDAAKEELDFLVRRAIELDPKDGLALAVAGHIASYIHYDYDRALGLFERSLRLDPNSAYAWDFSAVTLCYAGKADEALRQMESSQELWERQPDPYYFRTTTCIALLLAGQPERAAVVGRRTVRENPNFQAAYRPLIASLGLIGEAEEARSYLADMRRLQPDFSIDWFRANYPPLRGEHGDRYIEGLRKAGTGE
jgi:tetratricopeptide (TPR) repeat protein